MTRWQRFWHVVFPPKDILGVGLAQHAQESAINVLPLNPSLKTGNPFAYRDRTDEEKPPDIWSASTAIFSDLKPPADKPTLTELADLLEQLTDEGMPPRLQARHLAFHWAGVIREEERY